MKPTCTSRRPSAASASTTLRAAAAVAASGSSASTWMVPTPASRARRVALAGIASETATTSAAGTAVLSVRTCVVPMSPAPMTPTRTLIWISSSAPSDGGREVHVSAMVRGILRLLGPAAGDRLGAGVEADPLGPVDVVVAEQRVLPAAERVERHRHRDRDVDPDHPDLHPALEDARRLAAAREDRGPVRVRVRV